MIGMRIAGINWSFAIWWCLSYLIIAPLITYAVPVLGLIGFILSVCYLYYFKIDLGWFNGIGLGVIAFAYMAIYGIKQEAVAEAEAPDPGDRTDNRQCSFCGKNQSEVNKLIVSSGAYICDQCIQAADSMIKEETEPDHPETAAVEGPPARNKIVSPCSGCGAKPSKHYSQCEYCGTPF